PSCRLVEDLARGVAVGGSATQSLSQALQLDLEPLFQRSGSRDLLLNSCFSAPRRALLLRIRQHAALEIRDSGEERANFAGEWRSDARGAEQGPPRIGEAGVHGEELGTAKVDDDLILHPDSIRPFLRTAQNGSSSDRCP